MIQTYLFFIQTPPLRLYQLRFNKQKKEYISNSVIGPTTRFQHDQISYRILTRFLSKSQQPHTGSFFIFSFLHRVQTLNLPGSSDRALWSSKSKAYPRIHVRPSLAHDSFFTFFLCFFKVLVYASLFSLYLFPFFLFKM